MDAHKEKWTWDQLEQFFYLSNIRKDNIVFEGSLTELADEKVLRQLLSVYGKGINAKNDQATGMYLAGWFGYLCGSLHFFYSQGIKIDEDNLSLQIFTKENGHMWISFYVQEELEIFQKEWTKEIYQNKIIPIYKMLSVLTKNNPLHMWYQAAHSLYWVFHRMKHSSLSKKVVESCEKELQAFIESTEAESFGVKKHPFIINLAFIDNPWDSEDPLPIKPSCCLAYQTHSGHYCFTCPQMKKEERKKIAQEVLNKKILNLT